MLLEAGLKLWSSICACNGVIWKYGGRERESLFSGLTIAAAARWATALADWWRGPQPVKATWINCAIAHGSRQENLMHLSTSWSIRAYPLEAWGHTAGWLEWHTQMTTNVTLMFWQFRSHIPVAIFVLGTELIIKAQGTSFVINLISLMESQLRKDLHGSSPGLCNKYFQIPFNNTATL